MLPSYLDSMNPEPSLERPRACPTSFTGTAPRTQATTALPTVKARLRLRRRIIDFFYCIDYINFIGRMNRGKKDTKPGSFCVPYISYSLKEYHRTEQPIL